MRNIVILKELSADGSPRHLVTVDGESRTVDLNSLNLRLVKWNGTSGVLNPVGIFTPVPFTDFSPFQKFVDAWDALSPAPAAPAAPPTLVELAEEVRVALQSAIDDKAKSFGFISGGNALMLYAGFVNPFQPLAQTFATWEASVWYEAELYKAEVIAGTKPMLTPAEAVALMPTYPE